MPVADYLPERNLALELVRVTEAAAISAAREQGRGDKEAVDQAAVDAMRLVLSRTDLDGVVVIGEGEKDEAPMLYNGEVVGNGRPPLVDVAVDPVDGTRLTAEGRGGALAVIALAERGSMYSPGSLVYMDKLAVGEDAAGTVDIEAPVEYNLKQALIGDGDIQGAITTAIRDNGIDIMFGIGGSPEAVTAACAMAALRGEIQCKLWPRDDSERHYASENGHDLSQVLTTRDLVDSDNTFFAATGVTTGALLRGVRFGGIHTSTHSVLMRSESGTVRFVEADHRVEWVEGEIKA